MKIYRSIEELQHDLDAWIINYNKEQPHSGQYGYGKTPIETFNDSLKIAKDKLLNSKHDETLLTTAYQLDETVRSSPGYYNSELHFQSLH